MDVVVAGGTENMSQMPTLLPGKIQKIFNELFKATGQGIAKPGAALTGVLCCETATGFDGICTAVGCRAVIYSPYARFSQSRGGVGESLIVLAAPTNPAVTRASPQSLD
jgi:hypothetical protein